MQFFSIKNIISNKVKSNPVSPIYNIPAYRTDNLGLLIRSEELKSDTLGIYKEWVNSGPQNEFLFI